MFNKDFKLHHIGVATKDIEKERKAFEQLGYSAVLEAVDDIQKVKLLFMKANNQPMIELVQNLYAEGPVSDFIKKGIKLYHYAYETNDIERDLEYFTNELRAIVVCPITKANCFEKICFVMLRNFWMIELVQPNNII